MSSPIYDNCFLIFFSSDLGYSRLEGMTWKELFHKYKRNDHLQFICTCCVVSTFKIQERRKEHWWETCKFEMYKKQNNHQWLPPSFVTQWYSPPIRKSSNVLDWNLLKCILMGPAASRFRDTELGAPLGHVETWPDQPKDKNKCKDKDNDKYIWEHPKWGIFGDI